MMQQGQAGQRQAQQAQQAAIQAELQAQQARYQYQQQRRRQRQVRYPGPFVSEETARAASPAVSWPQASARRGSAKTAATWVIVVVAIFWLIVKATHIELIRQHDGPITPIPYFLAVVVSVLAVGFLLSLYVLRARPSADSAIDRDGANMPPIKDLLDSRAGQADGVQASPIGADAGLRGPGAAAPQAAAGGDTVQCRTQGDSVTGSAVRASASEQILTSARAAYANGDFQASAEGFKKLVNSPIHAADACYGLGMVALAQGRRQEAEKLFAAGIRADRTHANAWYQIGRLRESQSPAEALTFYREALRLNPQHAGAMRKLGVSREADVAQSAGAPKRPDAPPTARGVAAGASPAGGEGHQFTDAPSGHLRGRVAGFQRRAEQSFFLHRLYLYVWDFRVERPGMAPVMIEMRGFRFRGDISNGDVVDIAGDASPGRVLRVRQLLNLTTDAEIKTSYGRGPRILAAAAKIGVALIFLAVVIRIASLIIQSASR